MNVFEQLGLKDVINACGRMTLLGTSICTEEVSTSVKDALEHYVVLEDLMSCTGDAIAEATGSEAGCPAASAAAGIVLSVAACITGCDRALIDALPDSEGLKNEVIIQKGHVINFGASINQMIRMAGGVPVEAGTVNKTHSYHIQSSINHRTAALMYTQSHHSVQKGMLPLEELIKIGRKYNVPVLVDAAAEEDLCRFTALGADLVVYSGAKALCGPTSGFICGRESLIKACAMQYEGIGRAMKVSKEAMAGLITALRSYDMSDTKADRQKTLAGGICEALDGIQGLSCSVVKDETGREIYRAQLRVDESLTGISASELFNQLCAGDPAIVLRPHSANLGILYADMRPLLDGQQEIIATRIRALLTKEEEDEQADDTDSPE